MVFWYKNSFLASVVAIIGSIMATAGVYTMIDGMIGEGLPLLLIGIALIFWGKKISADKSFKTWWKQVTDNNLEPQIAQNMQVAIEIYNKNPDKRTLAKIEALNPAAANYIRNNLIKK